MSADLTILVGTVTGNAELVAEEMQLVLKKERGMSVRVQLLDAVQPDVLRPGGTYLVCTSTYGVGDLPDNAQDFFDELTALAPDLRGTRFGVYTLGDSVYSSSFCRGGEHFDSLLRKLGAVRVGELGRHDASEDGLAEDCGADWVRGWVRLLD